MVTVATNISPTIIGDSPFCSGVFDAMLFGEGFTLLSQLSNNLFGGPYLWYVNPHTVTSVSWVSESVTPAQKACASA